MRIFSVLIIVFIMFFFLAGCSPVASDLDDGNDMGGVPDNTPNNTPGEGTQGDNNGGVFVDIPSDIDMTKFTDIPKDEWSVYYHKTSWSGNGNNTMLIHSVDELDDFYLETGLRYIYRSQVLEDNQVINDGIYNEEFFSEKFLLIISCNEPSGSIRHKVTSLSQDSNMMIVNIDRHQPEMQTADMARWVIVIELNNDFAGFEFAVIWESIPFDITELSAPADDLLGIEFFGAPADDDGTFAEIFAVMFVFDGVHDMFNTGAISHWGRLLSFEDDQIVDHDYTTVNEKGSYDKILFDGKTGFLLHFGTPIDAETYGIGTYLISFEYFGEMVEAEPATVVEPPPHFR